MSDRFLMFGDLHLHPLQGDWRKVEDAIQVLDWIKETALKREIKDIFFLGDWFHVRGYLYPSLVARTYTKLLEFKDAGLDMKLIVGNHDLPYRSTTQHNSLTAFNSIFPVIEQPSFLEGENYDFYFLPYVENATQLQWAIQRLLDGQGEQPALTSKKKVLLAHLDIQEAMLHNAIISTLGISQNDLTSFDMVFSGHYHTKQKVGENVWYVGSPYQQNFGEANQEKGIMIFDNGKIENIFNTFSPRHMYITADEIGESIRGNYIKVQAGKTDNVAALRAKAAQFNPRSLVVTLEQQNVSYETMRMKSESKDVKSLLREWVDKTANNEIYDKERLFKLGLKIVEDAMKEVEE